MLCTPTYLPGASPHCCIATDFDAFFVFTNSKWTSTWSKTLWLWRSRSILCPGIVLGVA